MGSSKISAYIISCVFSKFTKPDEENLWNFEHTSEIKNDIIEMSRYMHFVKAIVAHCI